MRIRRAAVVAVVPVLAVPLTATPAQAASPVRFSVIQFNPSGSDTHSNRQINREWAKITNHGQRTRTLTGWRVRDRAGHVFRFPSFRLGSGATVTLHTGKGRDGARNLYWGQGWYVWNNTGDRATLKNRSGAVADTCSWGGSGPRVRC